jgi:hypothetical protein
MCSGESVASSPCRGRGVKEGGGGAAGGIGVNYAAAVLRAFSMAGRSTERGTGLTKNAIAP